MYVIPKIIHQTIASKSKIHPELRENIKRLINLNPDWTYCLYDDSDCRTFISQHYDAEKLGLYDRISPRYGAAKADFFRYLVVYEKGGVYLDIKSTAIQPLSLVLPKNLDYLISTWDNRPGGREEGAGRHARYGVDDEFQQWFIVASKAHPFLRAVIDRVSENIKNYDGLSGGLGASGVLRTTGPIAYTLAISPILDLYPHDRVDIYDFGFRYSCLLNDERADRHREIIPSYREIRFPVIRCAADDSFKVIFLYGIATLFAYLHEITKVGGYRKRFVKLKKERRARVIGR